MGEISQSLQIIGLKGKKRVRALFDSGATDNFVSLDLANEIGLVGIKKAHFIVADGRKKIGMMTSAIIEIMNRSGESKLIISNVLPQDGYDVILGQRFLQDNEVVLDFKKDKLRFNTHQPINRRIARL